MDLSILEEQQIKKKRNKVGSSNVKISETGLADIEPVFEEREIAELFQAKCLDLSIKMYPQQFIRFRDTINKVCYNRKCNLQDMYLGPLIVKKLGHFIEAGKIANLNLQMNNIGNRGLQHVADVVKRSQCLVRLNLASNDVSSEGMITIFDAMS